MCTFLRDPSETERRRICIDGGIHWRRIACWRGKLWHRLEVDLPREPRSAEGIECHQIINHRLVSRETDQSIRHYVYTACTRNACIQLYIIN